MTDRHYLFITYAYPHFKAVGSFRTFNIAEELVQNGARVTVVTTNNYSFLPKQILPIHPNIELKRIPSFDYNFVKGLIFKNKKRGGSNTATSKNSFSLAFRIMDTFPINILFGLGGFLYIFLALCYILPRIKRFTHIFSSFRPYGDHFIAYIIKNIRPSLYWIADFRDIHVDHENINVLSIPYQEYINKKIFRKSDVLVTVSKGYLNSLKKYNPNFQIIPNGIGRSLIDSFKSIESSLPSKFTISHVGSLYGGRRDPSFLFEVISKLVATGRLKLDQIRLQYAGSDGSLWFSLLKKYNLEASGIDLGSVDHKTAIKVQKFSHINLMLTWATEKGGTFPAKFFEYLVAQRPILLLVNGDKDPEFEEIFDEHQIGFLCYNTTQWKNELAEFILERITNPSFEFDEKILIKYNWNQLVKKFELLKN